MKKQHVVRCTSCGNRMRELLNHGEYRFEKIKKRKAKAWDEYRTACIVEKKRFSPKLREHRRILDGLKKIYRKNAWGYLA